MAEYWIGDAEGRVLGPVSLDVVQDLVNTGRLMQITRASRDGQRWGPPNAYPEVMALLLNAPAPEVLLNSERQGAARGRGQLGAMQGRPPPEHVRADRHAPVGAARTPLFQLVKRLYPRPGRGPA